MGKIQSKTGLRWLIGLDQFAGEQKPKPLGNQEIAKFVLAQQVRPVVGGQEQLVRAMPELVHQSYTRIFAESYSYFGDWPFLVRVLHVINQPDIIAAYAENASRPRC